MPPQEVYNIADIRALITKAFSDQELNTLCFDHFRPTYEEFGATQARTAKIQGLVEYCDRHLEIPRLLVLIKQHNESRYWEFISSQAHQAIGLPVGPVSTAQANLATIRQDYEAVQRKAVSIAKTQIKAFNDFKFWDRVELPGQILRTKANHIELYGPSGVGKTYLLQHLTRGQQGIRTIYINLNEHSRIDAIWSEVVRQLRGWKKPPSSASFLEVAKAIQTLHSSSQEQPVNHFLFLFDSATEAHREVIDWLVSPDGLINNEPFLQMLQALGIGENEVKLQVIIAARQPILSPNLRVESYHTNFRLERILLNRLERQLDPEQDPIRCMLRELADHRDFPLAPAHCQKIADKVYYLTAGHPKCAKLVLFAVAKKDFIPTSTDWRRFFETYVLPTIQQEILGPVTDHELLPIFWVLSIFRRFDQRLLGAFLQRQLLPGSLGELDISRQARQLRKRLMDTYLVNEPAIGESMYTLDFTVRRVLSLGMQYRFPERYRMINSVALEIFTDWLQDPQTTPGRRVMCLVDLVYHWFKILELDQNKDIYHHLEEGLEKYLPLLTLMIDEAFWPNYLSQLRDYWEKDEELQETAYQATGGSKCYDLLSDQIKQFVHDYMNKD
ncbi:MAG: hypothetical protein BroJett011_69240 [Chloroflexota bacterium]|nr:MAG: hypothetical protein BroJett011_69240 [Chloroflexota bacterium]